MRSTSAGSKLVNGRAETTWSYRSAGRRSSTRPQTTRTSTSDERPATRVRGAPRSAGWTRRRRAGSRRQPVPSARVARPVPARPRAPARGASTSRPPRRGHGRAPGCSGRRPPPRRGRAAPHGGRGAARPVRRPGASAGPGWGRKRPCLDARNHGVGADPSFGDAHPRRKSDPVPAGGAPTLVGCSHRVDASPPRSCAAGSSSPPGGRPSSTPRASPAGASPPSGPRPPSRPPPRCSSRAPRGGPRRSWPLRRRDGSGGRSSSCSSSPSSTAARRRVAWAVVLGMAALTLSALVGGSATLWVPQQFGSPSSSCSCRRRAVVGQPAPAHHRPRGAGRPARRRARPARGAGPGLRARPHRRRDARRARPPAEPHRAAHRCAGSDLGLAAAQGRRAGRPAAHRVDGGARRPPLVLTVLREPDPTDVEPPTTGDLDELVGAARAAGQEVRLVVTGEAALVPAAHRLAVHRVVREG